MKGVKKVISILLRIISIARMKLLMLPIPKVNSQSLTHSPTFIYMCKWVYLLVSINSYRVPECKSIAFGQCYVLWQEFAILQKRNVSNYMVTLPLLENFAGQWTHFKEK
jgi:hypothetical protein